MEVSNYIQEFQCRVQERFGKNLVSMILYGSTARGGRKESSDIDLLLIVKAAPKDQHLRKKMTNDIETDIEQCAYHAGQTIIFSVLLKTQEEASVHCPLYLDMVLDAKFLFDREHFFRNILHNLQKNLEKLSAKRITMGKKWYWNLKPDYQYGETFHL